jgi:hypothetical protein
VARRRRVGHPVDLGLVPDRVDLRQIGLGRRTDTTYEDGDAVVKRFYHGALTGGVVTSATFGAPSSFRVAIRGWGTKVKISDMV